MQREAVTERAAKIPDQPLAHQEMNFLQAHQ